MTPSAMLQDGSVPDLDSPVRQSLGAVGTPRRNGSLTSSSINGNYGAIGTRMPSNGMLSQSRVNSPDVSDVDDLWRRYNHLKNTDLLKNALTEEVLRRYTQLQQRHEDYVKEVEDRTAETGRPTLETYRNWCDQLLKMLNASPTMMVLIDGDGMIFHNSLLRRGEQGGREAADMLRKAVADVARRTVPDCPENFQVVARVYANVSGLAETCTRGGLVSQKETIEEFVRGFTNGDNLFNFIDVGPGKDRTGEKMKAEFESTIQNYQCRQVFFGCSHDDGFARLLEKYTFDEFHRKRVTLLEGVPFEKELRQLDYKKAKLDGVFRDSKIITNIPDLLIDFPRVRQDSKNPFNPTSGVFTPASRTPVLDTPNFSPRSGPPGIASPAAIPIRRDVTRTNSFASSTAGAETPASTNCSVGGGGWANIARGSAHLPMKDLTKTVPEPKSTGPVVRQNKLGFRIDAPMDYNHDKVFELKKMKYCNQHYIGKGCCHWESDNGKCPHKHDTKLTKEDLKWLRVVARETVCKRGTQCVEVDCIYGHHCPYPKDSVGSMRGIGCINGEHCRFSKEMHGVDMTVATIIRPEVDFE